MPILPFSILSYGQSNPAFYQVGQQVNISPVPGFSAVSYVLTGSLPAGLTFSTSLGTITGTPTTLTPATTLTITATLADTTTTSCEFIISIINIPPQAKLANESSADNLTALRQQAENLFIQSVEQVVNNNNALGKFSAYFDVPEYVSMNFIMTYFQNLNYIYSNLYPSQNIGAFEVFFGGVSDFSVPNNIDTNGFVDFTQPFALAIPNLPRRIKLSWSPLGGIVRFPFGF